MEKFGFCEKFINWIKECVTTVSFSVLVNNGPTDLFVPERGLRQGDPMSPYLFILGAEILARNLQLDSQEKKKSNIGFKISQGGIRVPFLAFADDIMIFSKATTASCESVKKIIENYCAISGQKVNYHKSAFQTTNKISNAKKLSLQNTLNIPSSASLEKYLGAPIFDERVNQDTFSEILNKSKLQLAKWKSSSLSQAGRTLLIKANLAARPNFIMQSFQLPTKVHDQLDQINRCFFWNKDKNYKPLIGWDKICLPKASGGLGIRKSKDMNDSLQMKLLWKILVEPNTTFAIFIECTVFVIISSFADNNIFALLTFVVIGFYQYSWVIGMRFKLTDR